jgi:HSP20 family protein
MEKKLKEPLHVTKGKVVKTEKETQGTSSTTGKVEVNKGTSYGKVEEPSTKEKIKGKKADMDEQIEEIKEGVKEEKEEYEKQSEKEGRTPAEKVLNDIVSRFRQGTDQINEAISDYNKPESDEENNPKEALKPLVDVLETNNTIYLIADISGVKKENISLGISKKSVEITANYMEDPDIEDAKFVQKERSYGKTHRKVELSSEIKVHEAKANFRNCTLKITLPKVVEDITKVNIDD